MRHRLTRVEKQDLSDKIARLYQDFDIKSIARILNVRVDLIKRVLLDLLAENKIYLRQPKKCLVAKNTKIEKIFPGYLSGDEFIAIKSENTVIIRPLQTEDVNF